MINKEAMEIIMDGYLAGYMEKEAVNIKMTPMGPSISTGKPKVNLKPAAQVQSKVQSKAQSKVQPKEKKDIASTMIPKDLLAKSRARAAKAKAEMMEKRKNYHRYDPALEMLKRQKISRDRVNHLNKMLHLR